MQAKVKNVMPNGKTKNQFVHTLNGSGLATPRLLVALVETYQNKEGKVSFPEDIAKFLGMSEIV